MHYNCTQCTVQSFTVIVFYFSVQLVNESISDQLRNSNMSKKFWLRTQADDPYDPHTDTTSATVLWTIDNFMDRKEEKGQSILSPCFRIKHNYPGFSDRDTKWQIQLYPRGDHDSYDGGSQNLPKDIFDGQVSVFLHGTIGKIKKDDVVIRVSIVDNVLNRIEEKALKHRADAKKISCVEDACYGESNYIPRYDLYRGYPFDIKMLPGKSLTLEVKLSIHTIDYFYEELIPTGEKDENEGVNSQSKGTKELGDNLGKLLEDKESCDMEIHCGGKVFPCHKLLLSARSPVFKAMFQANMKESESGKVTIEDIKPEIMDEILHFIYTGSLAKGAVKTTTEFAIELLAAANKYQLEALKDICQDKIRSVLDAENAIEFLILGEMYQANKLKDTAMMEVVYNMPEIADTEDYKRLVNYPQLLMEIPKAMFK